MCSNERGSTGGMYTSMWDGCRVGGRGSESVESLPSELLVLPPPTPAAPPAPPVPLLQDAPVKSSGEIGKYGETGLRADATEAAGVAPAAGAAV
jgi:hypothetical protein